MPSYDAKAVTCHVHTFKEGLLSAVAHDLKLVASKLELTVDEGGGTVVARIDATALKVVCAMKDGREAHGSLSDKDKADIEKNMAADVLDVRRHPTISFESTRTSKSGDGWAVEGKLSIKGTPRPVSFHARREGDRLVARIPLHQPDFGIKPFSAMLGTLKIKPGIEVLVSVPA